MSTLRIVVIDAVALGLALPLARFALRRRAAARARSRLVPAGRWSWPADGPVAGGAGRGPIAAVDRVARHAVLVGAVAIGAVAIGAAAVLRQPVVALAAAGLAAATALARWGHRLGAGRRLDRALAPAVEQLGRQLRSGASLTAALAVIADDAPGELGEQLRRCQHAVAGGTPLPVALHTWAASQPRPSVRLVAAVLGIGHAGGGLRAHAVDELAAWLRAADEAQREAAALAAQAQASAAVMVVAPVVFAVLLGAGDAAARRFLLHSTAGAGCVAAALLLDLGAAAVMVRAVAGFAEDHR